MMIAAGTALCGTGLGTIIGASMIAFGASSVIQGTANTALAIAGSKAECPNPLRLGVTSLAGAVAGEKGAKIAGGIYDVVDFALGFVNGGSVKYIH